MPEYVRLWKILEEANLKEIQKSKLDLEKRLENWLERDISIISSNLLIIGCQVDTDFCGIIDLLCLEPNGDVGILELKRDKTPREITAQTLDYASWVKGLSNDRITEIADKYLGDNGPLVEAFRKKFGIELPDILNEHHKMLIVASEIDASSERIIKYLSDSYGVAINVATFQYFRDEDGREFLARVFLIDPSQVDYSAKTKTASKRKPPLTYEQLQDIAERNGVGEMYLRLTEGLTNYFEQIGTNRSAIVFSGFIGEGRCTMLNILPGESSANLGIHFYVYIDKLSEYLDISRDDVSSILPSGLEDYVPWKDAPPMLSGFFSNSIEIKRFLSGIGELKHK